MLQNLTSRCQDAEFWPGDEVYVREGPSHWQKGLVEKLNVDGSVLVRLDVGWVTELRPEHLEAGTCMNIFAMPMRHSSLPDDGS